jgi:hypothetical protein
MQVYFVFVLSGVQVAAFLRPRVPTDCVKDQKRKKRLKFTRALEP